jgi:hypothetical protein
MNKPRMHGGIMERALIGFAIGLLAGPALAVMVVLGALACLLNGGGGGAASALLFGLFFVLPGGLAMGPSVGAVIGVMVGLVKRHKDN